MRIRRRQRRQHQKEEAPLAEDAGAGRGRRGVAWSGAALVQYLCSFTLEADERKIRERGGGEADAPVARHSWLAKQSSADLESEFRAADETTSLLHRREAAPSRFDTGQFSFRDAAQ